MADSEKISATFYAFDNSVRLRVGVVFKKSKKLNINEEKVQNWKVYVQSVINIQMCLR